MANRYIVEIIKDCQELQKNLDQYLDSDNLHMRKEYDKLRKKISKLLRKIHIIANDEDPKRHLITLEKMLEKSKKSDVLEDGTLDQLIRENLIRSEMASSLINDSAIVGNISKNLIRITELLYIESDVLIESFTESDLIIE